MTQQPASRDLVNQNGSSLEQRTNFNKRPDFISNELLTAFHPLVKLPLPLWIKSILHNLPVLNLNDEYTISGYDLISVSFNQAALIEYYFGRTENAYKLCYSHLAWLAYWIKSAGKLELISHATEPWINIGRLERLEGRYASSLTYFKSLLEGVNKAEITLGPVKFGAEHWQVALKLNPDLVTHINNVCNSEIIKTLLKSKEYNAVLSYIEQERAFQGAGNSFLSEIMLEAKVVALARLNRLDQALNLARVGSFTNSVKPQYDYNQNLFFLHRLIYHLRQVELLAQLDQAMAAIEHAKAVANIARTFQYDGEFGLLKVNITYRLVKLLQYLSQPALAYELAKLAYKASCQIQDEPLQLLFLNWFTTLELKLSHPEFTFEQAQWQEQFQKLVQITNYQSIRNGMLNLITKNNHNHTTNILQQYCEADLGELFRKLTNNFSTVLQN